MPIYLDYNATTPIDPAVADAMLPYMREHFGNPSSTHPPGRKARDAVERARAQVAGLLGARPEDVIFTSGGTESNNTAIRGAAAGRGDGRGHLVTSAIEHPAVLAPCRALEREGYALDVVAVDAQARVDPQAVADSLRPDTVLVSVMHANNEVGTIQPIREIARASRERGVLFHTDAAQSVGKIPVRVNELGVDLLSLAGHKLYASKGVGALWIRDGVRLPPLLYGASHESGRRAGTENVLEIVGLGKACEIAAARLEETARHAREMRDRLWQGISTARPDARRHGDPENGLPNTLSVGIPGVRASDLLEEIGDRVAASAGAACHAEGVSVSTVLEAIGVPVELAVGTIRFSVGRPTSVEEIDEAVRVVTQAAGA